MGGLGLGACFFFFGGFWIGLGFWWVSWVGLAWWFLLFGWVFDGLPIGLSFLMGLGWIGLVLMGFGLVGCGWILRKFSGV